jgi:hypothetical protein
MGKGPDRPADIVRPVTDDRPASECGMSPSAQEPPVSDPAPAAPAPPMQAAEHLTIAAARDLLDWLQGQGVRAHEVKLEPDGTMTVRWPG